MAGYEDRRVYLMAELHGVASDGSGATVRPLVLHLFGT